MGKQRKNWSTDVKEAIVLSVLRGELGVAEAARRHGAISDPHLENLVSGGGPCPRLVQNGTRMGPARLSGDRQDQGVTTLERENDRLKRIVAEKELELDISQKVRRL